MFRIALARPPRAVFPSIARCRRLATVSSVPPSEGSTSGNGKVTPSKKGQEEKVEKVEKASAKTPGDVVRSLLSKETYVWTTGVLVSSAMAYGVLHRRPSFTELNKTLEQMSEADLEGVFSEPPRMAETEAEMFGEERILDTGRPTRLDPKSLPTPPLDPSGSWTEEQWAASLVHGRGIHVPVFHKPTYGIPVASIQFRSHHKELLDLVTHFATHAASSLGIPCSQPVYLPNKRSMWTVPRSPFAHKKSQENFERIVYKRAVKAWDADPEVIDRWFRYLRRHALGGVGMRTTKWERMSMSVGQLRMENVDKLGKKQGLAGEKIKALGAKIVEQELLGKEKRIAQ
ncbi:hypothetical protein H0H92_009087 [Tricholoma furcatifolium]|nr:hypothetical protein H0H92_009087 [Tricholoma furcatifolium]